MSSVFLDFGCERTAFLNNAERIFLDRLARRGCVPASSVVIRLELNPRYAAEEFAVSGAADGKRLLLSGGDERALLYALGKVLRNGKYTAKTFTPGSWRGILRPAKPYRCAYLASHFFNFYQVAPESELESYLEDLALLGYNHLGLTCGIHVLRKNSSEYFKLLDRMKRIFKFGNRLGMKGFIFCGNGGFADSPAALRARPTGRSFFGSEICPSKPEGLEYIVKNNIAKLEYLRDVDLGMICIWPYDQGGCGCEKCRPYGANGMFIWATALAPKIKELWPEGKIVWSTWLYDRVGQPQDEWEGLYRKIENGEADWIDIIMADSHQSFPPFPLSRPLPRKVELVTFPEISMYGRSPWGGFGATPLPRRFAGLWGEICHLSSGGVLYSEGIFEDFNKALYADFFIRGSNATGESIREYCNWEFGLPESAQPDFSRLLEIFEDNHEGLQWIWDNVFPNLEPMKNKPLWRIKGKSWRRADEALKLARQLDAMLPEWGRRAWRWRLFYLRAVIDFRLSVNDNEPDEEVETALTELSNIYRLDPRTATRRVTPYTDIWLKHYHGEAATVTGKVAGVD